MNHPYIFGAAPTAKLPDFLVLSSVDKSLFNSGYADIKSESSAPALNYS